MEKSAKLAVYADHTRNTISKNIFGHFMEHSVDVIYGSVFDPESPLADEDGFRRDVLEALRDAKVPMLRYPGGNFVSNYHWEDGIGPREKRPKCFDYAWLAEDDNRMGTVEFIKLCRKTGAEPYLCVNMGSGTAEEAMHWVEFCNGTGNTRYAALRKSLGYEEPFHVKYWGLGNELYGDWQFGAMNASDYAKKALDFAKAMKWMDPEIELVACGYDLGSDWNYEVARVLKPLIGIWRFTIIPSATGFLQMRITGSACISRIISRSSPMRPGPPWWQAPTTRCPRSRLPGTNGIPMHGIWKKRMTTGIIH